MSLAFHATPAPGEWLNDPNGLVRTGSRWVMFAQHRADAPDFRATNWARFTSPDLLRWSFDAPVIASDGGYEAYSGSVVITASGLEAFYTVHINGNEHQTRCASDDAGRTWRPLPLTMPASASGANVRDPSVFGTEGDWWMLLARPCPWTGWETAPPSEIAILRSTDRVDWAETGTIGPCHAPGIMWEVPTLIRDKGGNLLLISCVDRRGGGADCAVFGWAGQLGPTGFVTEPDWPVEGRCIDQGPDFYATIIAAGAAPQPMVAWLASWATARSLAWPNFAGGPITLPRRITSSNGRICNEPWPAIADAFTMPHDRVPLAGRGTVQIDGTVDFALAITSELAEARIDACDKSLTVSRTNPSWHRSHPGVLGAAATRTLTLFIDGPATELFIAPEGLSVSLGLPGAGPRRVALTVAGAAIPFSWHILEPAA